MKKQEKTQKTKQRILDAALEEFGSKSYDAASGDPQRGRGPAKLSDDSANIF